MSRVMKYCEHPKRTTYLQKLSINNQTYDKNSATDLAKVTDVTA